MMVYILRNFTKVNTTRFDIQVQCFRATPFSLEEETFLQIEQIIPLPETTEYMIDAKEKEKEKEKKITSKDIGQHKTVRAAAIQGSTLITTYADIRQFAPR